MTTTLQQQARMSAVLRQACSPLVPTGTCRFCDGQGFTVEPVAQCGDYEHEHGDGCEIPEQVPCRCVRAESSSMGGRF